jgi:hypothetical protein
MSELFHSCMSTLPRCMACRDLHRFDLCPRDFLGRMPRRPFPAHLEGLVQLSPMDFDEGPDAAIRVGAAYDR